MFSINKIIEVAGNEVGYLEKATNSQLESKTANAGMNNYTKYGLARGCNGQPWCDAFVDWCFIQAYGSANAKMLLGGFSNYTPTSAQYFKNMKRWYTSGPQVGDVIFFKNSTRICHTGIVYKVDSIKVYTIEGNTNGGSTLEANGGAVAKKSYNLSYARIAGYGRPNYNDNTVKPTIPTGYVKYGTKGTQALLLQKCLNFLNIKTEKGKSLSEDGDFGSNSVSALIQFQKKFKLDPDGEYGPETKKVLTREVNNK